MVMTEMPKILVDGGSIRVKFNMTVTENQMVLEHELFGKIYNNTHKQFPTGAFTVTIRRVLPGKRDSVWVLEDISLQEKPRDDSIQIIGIVVSQSNGFTYVWCKERPPGQDVTIKTALPIGAWITFFVEKSDFDTFFPKEMPTNGFLPRYEINNYYEIDEIHITSLSGASRTTVNLELECHVDENNQIEDLNHPFVGLIVNESQRFPQSGTYSITIIRTKPSPPIRSVWFLRKSDLKKASPAQPIQTQSSIEQRLREMSINDPSSIRTIPLNNEPSSSDTAPPRYSRLADQTRNLETQSEYSLNEDAPIPAPRRSRGASRRREVRFGERTPSRGRSLSRGQSLARGRTPSRGPAARTQGLQTAIIYKIVKYETYENIFVWLLVEHKEAILKLKVAAEKFHLEMGSTFEAEFFESDDGKVFSTGPVYGVSNDEYDIRRNNTGGIDIRVYAEDLKHANATDKYPNIYHSDFGRILDNFNQLQDHRNAKYHMYIRRSKVRDEHRWVVFEQILLN